MKLNDYLQIRYKKARISNARKSFFYEICLVLFIVGILFYTTIGVTVVDSNMNTPNLKDRDIVFYFKLRDNYAREDVVYYKYDNENYFRRIKATEGVVIDATVDNKLTINGNIQPMDREKGIFYEARVINPDPYPFTVKQNQYFVLADLRGDAVDSRTFGPLDKSNILGKTFMIIRKRNF